jgi:neutral ceramidase
MNVPLFQTACCFLLVAALTVACTDGHAATVSRPLKWKGAAASIVITPAKNSWLAGYAGRSKPAEGKVQDLFAKGLALQDEQGQRLVIVTLDLIGVPQSVRHRLAARVRQELSLPPQFLLLNASHTHSGPSLRGTAPTAKELEDERIRDAFEYTQRLEQDLFHLVAGTLATLEPVRLTWSRARAGFAVNRRLPTPQGYRLAFNPDGLVDHEVPVLSVEGAGGELRAMLFGYACHNTCLGEYTYCGDYAGYAQEYLQAGRKDFTAMFLMGCAGDQSPQSPNRRGPGVVPRLAALDVAKQHGRALAIATEMANIAPQREVRGPLRAAYEEVPLDYTPEKAKPAHSYPVQVIAFGSDLTVVALGSEVVVDYSLRLKRELAGEAAVWIAGYSNDDTGYIPSRRVLQEGGYEAKAGWTETIEERIISKVHELHRLVSQPNVASR